MATKSTPPTPPPTDDTLGGRRAPSAPLRGRFAAPIERYLATLYASGDDADERQTKALEELRSEAAEAVIALAKAEAACARHDYPRRWALVYAATRMEHDAALPYLRELILTPLPPREAKDPHAFSAAREETILRTTAVDGVERLARRGNERALDALLEFLDVPSVSVRRASVQAILAVAPDDRERVLERLPRDFHYLLDVRQAQVTEVPQVKDPRKHLRDKKPGRTPAPPAVAPDGPGKPARGKPPSAKGAPKRRSR